MAIRFGHFKCIQDVAGLKAALIDRMIESESVVGARSTLLLVGRKC